MRKLHQILQAAFGWTDSHLHNVKIDGRTYAMGDNDNMLDLFAEDPEMLDDRKARLYRIAYQGHRFLYRHDFGDDWHHDIHVEELLKRTMTRTAMRGLVLGKHACPTEDVGGTCGYAEMLRVLSLEPDSDETKR